MNNTNSQRWILGSLSLSMLLASFSTSIANVALPTLVQAFHVSFNEIQWVVLAYLLASTTVIVSVGRVGDVIGHRQLLLFGILLFTIASVLCAVTSMFWLLIVARVVQGLGAAIMIALTMAFVSDAVPKTKIGSAMGMLATMSAVGTALGPSLGGVLISVFNWRAIFLVMALLGALTLAIAYQYLPVIDKDWKEQKVRFDHAGMFVLGMTLAAYALAMTMGRGDFGAINTVLLGAAACGVILFLFIEGKSASPLVPLELFQNSALSGGFALSALVTTVMMTTLIVGPFYLTQALGLDAAHVGIVMSVGPIVVALSGIPAGRLVDRYGAKDITIGGLMGIGTGCFGLFLIPMTYGSLGYAASIAVTGLGYSLFQTANNTIVMMDIRQDQRGVVSGLLNLSRNLGLITGASVMGAIFAWASGTNHTITASPDAVASGMRITFVFAGILIFCALVIMFIRRSRACNKF